MSLVPSAEQVPSKGQSPHRKARGRSLPHPLASLQRAAHPPQEATPLLSLHPPPLRLRGLASPPAQQQQPQRDVKPASPSPQGQGLVASPPAQGLASPPAQQQGNVKPAVANPPAQGAAVPPTQQQQQGVKPGVVSPAIAGQGVQPGQPAGTNNGILLPAGATKPGAQVTSASAL